MRVARASAAPMTTRAAAPGSRPIDVAGESWVATDLARETFADASWRDHWVVEGDATCEARDGRLNVVMRDKPGASKAATLWWRDQL